MASSSLCLLNAKYEKGKTPLIMACDALNVDLITALLNEGIDVDDSDDDKITALMATINSFRGNPLAEPRKVEIVKALLEAGADKSLVNRIGQPALILAAIGGYREIIMVLVDDDPVAAAELIPDKYGEDFYERMSDQDQEWFDNQYPDLIPKNHFTRYEKYRREMSSLCAFITTGAKPSLADLLNNDYGNNQPLLIKACLANDLDLVKEIIVAGDNLGHQDIDGNTALIHAAKQQNLDIIKILIDAGIDISKKNNDKKDFYDVMIPHKEFQEKVYTSLPDLQSFFDAKKFGI